MNAPRFALCLILLASSLGFAQAPGQAPPPEPSLTPPPLVPAPTSPPLVPAPAEPAPPAPKGELFPHEVEPGLGSPRFAPGRLTLEAVGGLVGGAGLGVAAFLSIGGLFALTTDCDETCAAAALVLALPAVAIGVPLGVYIAGNLMEGQGRFLPTLGGMFAGVGAALLMAVTGSAEVVSLAFLALPITGAIIGYELSHPDSAGAPEKDDGYGDGYARGGLQVLPVLGVTARGGFVGGLSGRF